MTKTKAKTVTCFLLGAEGAGVLAAFVVSVLTIAEWGGASISGYGKWIVCNGFYLLSAMALFYGFVFRPIRRKALKLSVPSFISAAGPSMRKALPF